MFQRPRAAGRICAATVALVGLVAVALLTQAPTVAGAGFTATAATDKAATVSRVPTTDNKVPTTDKTPHARHHRTIAPARATWVWDGDATPAAMLDWANTHQVGELFVQVTHRPSEADLKRFRELKAIADSAGVMLAALGGDPSWTFDHAAALAWQRTAMDTGLFYRTHVDVEPYLLSAWHSDQAGTAAAYLSLLEALQAADERGLEADVPFWFGTIPVGGSTLADQLLTRVDAVTVMSYRDSVKGQNSIMEVGADMLTRADRAGKPARLAVQTAAEPDCTYCTFYEEGSRALARALTAIDSAALAHRSYAGVAVHHYTEWTRLRD